MIMSFGELANILLFIPVHALCLSFSFLKRHQIAHTKGTRVHMGFCSYILKLAALQVCTAALLLVSFTMSSPLANVNKPSVAWQHVLKQIRAHKTTGILLFSLLHHVFINLHLDLMSVAIKWNYILILASCGYAITHTPNTFPQAIGTKLPNDFRLILPD